MKRPPGSTRRVQEINQERKTIDSQIEALAKKAKARTITTAENETLIRLRRRHQELGRKLAAITRNREFDPLALSRSRSTGNRGPQGPAGGIRRVVQGGAPGSGKRA